jgi:hypothetical protein
MENVRSGWSGRLGLLPESLLARLPDWLLLEHWWLELSFGFLVAWVPSVYLA